MCIVRFPLNDSKLLMNHSSATLTYMIFVIYLMSSVWMYAGEMSKKIRKILADSQRGLKIILDGNALKYTFVN